jgi:orotidine-5'-phosphate decarboxylase
MSEQSDRSRLGNQKVLVALDVDSRARALELVTTLRGLVGGVKVGSRLFTMEGPSFIRELTDAGTRVFLDLKFHDIPNTVAQAVEAGTATGAWMLNVHASGGVPMMQAAARAAADTADKLGLPRPMVIAVTVLTSMDADTLQQVGVSRPLMDQVVTLADMARTAGLDGVVASPLETAAIRTRCGPDFLVVTPGIRGAAAGTEKNDQNRTMGPAEAVRAGSSYLVVGRPIIAAPDPRAAAEAIGRELAANIGA